MTPLFESLSTVRLQCRPTRIRTKFKNNNFFLTPFSLQFICIALATRVDTNATLNGQHFMCFVQINLPGLYVDHSHYHPMALGEHVSNCKECEELVNN